ncbi:MAG: bifunctional glutamate--cysteine ligase GshA/glutathione synthetase GshB [Clostridiales bacterium]|nr:bifunctional glutamate--cysteine ligase GshA/glutathione synthetase GshB [Clostridiales bacterium]
MINRIKKLFKPEEILEGNCGIEREGLRVNVNGILSKSLHSEAFGNKGENPYITTDFSESQVEVITPIFDTAEKVYNFSNILYDIVALEVFDEYIWPQSMPGVVPKDEDIPIAQFDGEKKEASHYREYLLNKYGGKKQLISGIHYNFSFSNKFLKKLYDSYEHKKDFKDFKNDLYLKMARNYIRYRWLLVYLMGASGVVHESFIGNCPKEKCKFMESGFTGEKATSYRNGECGYKNIVDLVPKYTSVKEYINSIEEYIKDKIINSHKELYTPVRLKAKDNKNFLKSLEEDGIEYLEYRSLDINPFEKGGVSLEDLKFLQMFNIYLLLKDEKDYDFWQEEGLSNQTLIANYGLDDIVLENNGEKVLKSSFAISILEEMKEINSKLNLGREEQLEKAISKIKHPEETYSYRIYKKVQEEGFINAHISLAAKYKEEAYKNRFKLYGYEDLELSTQILMKEAIKRGIEISIVDRYENFISLKKNNKTEYVVQATKTSKDSYTTVLIMENKTVTKKVLKDNGVKVPDGDEFYSLDDALRNAIEYENRSIVIKPKSTNFGTGISIFKEGAKEEDIKKAFEIAFKYDNTVLVEEFIKGKEYRFLVIDNKVVGILHRVPANVVGDGVKSITELVEIKNQDPLRGYHYRTPLEKIKLEENAALFLKQQNKDFDYIPKKDEIVFLRENSNISTGGDSIDYTDLIDDKYKKIAVDAAKAVNAKICGVDMMIEDYKSADSDYAIIELNFNPAIHIHSYPYKGKERKIAEHVLKLLELI